MRGGVILVEGNAGTEIGCTMRRGLIAIGGASGAFPGASMVAGTIFLFGPSGGRIGPGMKRGTIALCGRQEELLATFQAACLYRPIFLDLYFRQLRAWNFPVADALFQGRWQRFNGDLLALGKGEILQWLGEG
jgi:formylmethanofuran dehydrogenase subunit C